MDTFKNDEVLDYPNISKINFIKINKKYLKVLLINFFLFFVPLLVTLILLDLFAFNESLLKYRIIIYSSFFTFFVFIFLYINFSFPLRRYAVREKDITYKSGLFIRKMTTVPFSRIQHVEIDESVFSRLFKLASISVFTAGDSSDDLVIKGLSKEKALQIKEFISTKVND